MKVKSIKNVKNLSGKKIILRVDFNVPIEEGVIEDDYKIVKALPTIRFLTRHNAKVIIISHLGRPIPGEQNEDFSLEPVARKLNKLLGKKVNFVNDCVGLKAGTATGRMEKGDIVMLENIRFEKGEKENSKKLAKKLAKLGNIYVNDAFGDCHRSDMSVSAIKLYLPSYAGFLLENEVNHLEKIVNPKKPLVVVLGGSKIKTKIKLVEKLGKKAQHILIGGALANNFFMARKYEVGKSLIDEETIKFAKKYKKKNIILPVDVLVSTKKDGGRPRIKKINQVNKREYIYDLGPETIRLYNTLIKKANSIIWNGPMGRFEEKPFSHGTLAVARIIASRSSGQAFGVVGGGETVDALKETKMLDYIDWVSTGGGAMLSFLGGKKMPGLRGLIKK